MPTRGFEGNQTIVEGCRTCEHGLDEGDGLSCEVFCYMVKDRDFCILYKDDSSALHYFRILPRFHQGKFYKSGFDAKNKSLDNFQIIGVAAVGREQLERNLGIMNRSKEPKVIVHGFISQMSILDYVARKAEEEKKNKRKERKQRGYYSKKKHLGKEAQKMKNYRRK